jgi:hypothetical protein
MAVASTGEAAHIHAASPGGKRYLASMTKEQRTHIDNAIWMCGTHATLIDQDEVTYPAQKLVAWKREHEDRVAAELRGTSPRLPDLVAIGPDTIATGELVGGAGMAWQLRLEHFIAGGLDSLVRFGEQFDETKALDRYVLVNAIGDGRVLARPPAWKKVGNTYIIDADVMPRFPRTRAQDLGEDLALAPDGDLAPDFGTVSGVDALPQKIKLCLWHQRGELVFHSDFGSRLAEYYASFRGTPWLERLIKLEAIRLAAIPYQQSLPPDEYTPFQCVDRVISVELLAREPTNHWMPARIELDVVGLGTWTSEIPLFIPEPSTAAVPTPGSTGCSPE